MLSKRTCRARLHVHVYVSVSIVVLVSLGSEFLSFPKLLDQAIIQSGAPGRLVSVLYFLSLLSLYLTVLFF
jgi:hypothetical protein